MSKGARHGVYNTGKNDSSWLYIQTFGKLVDIKVL